VRLHPGPAGVRPEMCGADPTGVTHNEHFDFDRGLLLCQRIAHSRRDPWRRSTCGGFQTPRPHLSGRPRSKAAPTLIGFGLFVLPVEPTAVVPPLLRSANSQQRIGLANAQH